MKKDLHGVLIALGLIGLGVAYLKKIGFVFGYALPGYDDQQTDWR